jgi:NADH-quinone oxidoreductase subunit F/NADP-reducing hydrogenase subunit HndC
MDDCDGCHLCFKACPVDAITGVVKELHVIDHEACISCGACVDVCPTDSIRTFPKHELKAEVV